MLVVKLNISVSLSIRAPNGMSVSDNFEFLVDLRSKLESYVKIWIRRDEMERIK